jgi:SAM-dependent methyltransferase
MRRSNGNRRQPVREHTIVEHDAGTGLRQKRYSRTADVDYWTGLWAQSGDVSYARERRGHLAHQLRATFLRWVPPRARILEAGCGLARFTVAAHARGYRAEGLDWSAPTIDRLRQGFPEIMWHVGDIRRLAFAEGTFDAIYLPGVCEHFEEGPFAVLNEGRRVLRRGGIAIISTPCFNDWLQRHMPASAQQAGPVDGRFYEYAFTPSGLAAVLERLEFDVLQIHPYSVLNTFVRAKGWRVPRPFNSAISFGMDHLPVVRRWGSSCIWVARKR